MPDQSAVQPRLMPVRLVREPWSGFSRKEPAKHWVGMATVADSVGTVHLRPMHWLPFLGPAIDLRNVAHEVTHLIEAGFRTNDCHHDSDAYAIAGGTKHICGKGYSWPGFFSLKHLSPQALAYATELIKSGNVTVQPEAGSLLGGP